MDPYLEQYWGDVHHALCTYSRDMLRAALPPGLVARIDERTIIEDEFDQQRTVVPDVRVIERGIRGGAVIESSIAVAEPIVIHLDNDPVTEGFVQVIDTRNGSRVITVIEFTSPANKTSKPGRAMYLRKQADLIAGGVSLVEVDLIRSGPWILRFPISSIPPRQRGTYCICVSRGWDANSPEVYPVKLSERLPAIRIPLRRNDSDAVLDFQKLIDQVYENGSYAYDIDYSQPPKPPLEKADAAWAQQWLDRSQESK